MERMQRVLFVCTGNSCRSQMAEGWARHHGGNRIAAASAGVHPDGKNATAIAVMREAGVDISQQESSPLTGDMLEWAHLVVTVCSHADAQCPALPEGTKKLHWPLPDPATARGTEAEVEAVYRNSRDEIEGRVKELLESLPRQP
jgi:arsenate reductase